MVIQKNIFANGLILRTLLILLGGFLMALAALAGQVGYQDDYQIKGSASIETRPQLSH